MNVNHEKDRRAEMLLLLVFAGYGLTFLFCRAMGALTTEPVAPLAVAGRELPAGTLELPPRVFFSAWPPLLQVFYPALWLESRLAAPAAGGRETPRERNDGRVQQ